MSRFHKSHSNALRTFESLESRIALTVAAEVVNGNLLVSGQADGAVAIVGSAGGEFSIVDNGVEIASVNGVNKNIRIDLPTQDANDVLSIDLGGNSIRNFYANMGSGDNEIDISNGVVRGVSMIRGAAGNDSVTLAADLTLGNEANVWLGDGANDLDVAGQLTKSLVVKTGSGVDTFFMAPGSRVGGDLRATLGDGDNVAILDGAIGRNLSMVTGAGNDRVTLSDLATVDGATGISLGTGQTPVEPADPVDEAPTDPTGGTQSEPVKCDDSVVLAPSSNVGGNATLRLGSGNNTAKIEGTIGGNLLVTSDNPNDAFDVANSTVVGRSTRIMPGQQMSFAHARHTFHR